MLRFSDSYHEISLIIAIIFNKINGLYIHFFNYSTDRLWSAGSQVENERIRSNA